MIGSRGTCEEGAGIVFAVVATIFLVGWVESMREEGNDPTVSNIVHELNKCRDAALTYLNSKGQEAVRLSLREDVNYIDSLAAYMDVTEHYQENRYAFCLSRDILWVGCSLRRWKRSLFALWGTSIFDSFFSLLLHHPQDKMGRKNCKRLIRVASEVGLYGSSSLNEPPRSIEDRFYRIQDDVVWMPVSRIEYN